MIGIDFQEGRGEIALLRSSEPELLGRGASFEELFRLASESLGGRAASAPVAVAVPPWFHDGQRSEVREGALSAGFENVRAVNRPTAVVATRYRDAPPEGAKILVLELFEGRVEIAILQSASGLLEVLATDGSEQIPPDRRSAADRLLEEIRTPLRRALQNAGCAPEDLTDVLLARGLRGAQGVVADHPELFGPRASRAIACPEHVVACGAAILAASSPSAPKASPPAESARPVVRESRLGCLPVVVALVAAAVRWL